MRVYLRYDEILENSKKLSDIVKEYDEIINKINNTCNNIDKIWTSHNKDLEIENLKAINTKLNINKNYYHIFSEIIKSTNEDFLLTEQNATNYLTLKKETEVQIYE